MGVASCTCYTSPTHLQMPPYIYTGDADKASQNQSVAELSSENLSGEHEAETGDFTATITPT